MSSTEPSSSKGRGTPGEFFSESYALDPGSEVWVLVTQVNNPHDFYVRLLEPNDPIGIVEEANGPLNLVNLKLRATVIYRSSIKNKNIRGQVYLMQHMGSFIKCDMFAVDYGFTETGISSEELMMPKVFGPPLAIHCRLVMCEPIGEEWTSEASEAMKYFCPDNEKVLMTVVGKNFESLTVKLRNCCNDDISTMLAFSGYSKIGLNANDINRIEAPKPVSRYYTHKKLSISSTLQVRWQSGKVTETFFVADPIEYEEYLSEKKLLSARMTLESRLKLEEFVEGNPVAARVDKLMLYERAIIKKITIPKARALIQLIDWGTIQEVPLEWLKPIPDYFLHNPAVALYCCMDRKTLPDIKIHRFLTPGYQLKLKVVETGDGFEKPHKVVITSV